MQCENMQKIKITHCPVLYTGVGKYGQKFPGSLKTSRFQIALLLLEASSSPRWFHRDALSNLEKQTQIIYVHPDIILTSSTAITKHSPAQVISDFYLKHACRLPSLLITAFRIFNPGNIWLQVHSELPLIFHHPSAHINDWSLPQVTLHDSLTHPTDLNLLLKHGSISGQYPVTQV